MFEGFEDVLLYEEVLVGGRLIRCLSTLTPYSDPHSIGPVRRGEEVARVRLRLRFTEQTGSVADVATCLPREKSGLDLGPTGAGTGYP